MPLIESANTSFKGSYRIEGLTSVFSLDLLDVCEHLTLGALVGCAGARKVFFARGEPEQCNEQNSREKECLHKEMS